MKTDSILIAIGIGAFFGVVVVCGGLGAGLLWVIDNALEDYSSSWDYPPVTGIDYTLTGPTFVRAGEAASFIVEVTNTSDTEHRTLYSVRLYTELVDQGPVISNPEPYWYDHHQGNEYGELMFDHPLPPGETKRIEIRFTPTEPGRYYVNIDATIDSGDDFIERFHDLVVQPVDSAVNTSSPAN